MSNRFDYPPNREFVLGAVRDALESDIDDLQQEMDALGAQREEAEDPDPALNRELRDLRSEQNTLETHLDGVEWAIDQWDEESSVTLEALTTQARGETMSAVRTGRMGEVTQDVLDRYLTAAGIADAPFIEDDDDIHDVARLVGQLPPAVTDWIQSKQSELNDLGN